MVQLAQVLREVVPAHPRQQLLRMHPEEVAARRVDERLRPANLLASCALSGSGRKRVPHDSEGSLLVKKRLLVLCFDAHAHPRVVSIAGFVTTGIDNHVRRTPCGALLSVSD